MKVLAINNGRDHTAYTFIEGSEWKGYSACSDFLSGNITDDIKALYWRFHPDEIVLQLPPTGLDKRTQKAIQEGFGRNVAAAINLGKRPTVKDLMHTRSIHHCCKRETARRLFANRLKVNRRGNLTNRQHMQLINTLTLAWHAISLAERYQS